MVSEETRRKISEALKGKPKSAAHRAALKNAWAERGASPAQRANGQRMRDARTAESFAKQGASLSKKMKGRERTPAQHRAALENLAKAHAARLPGSGKPTVYGLWAVVGESLRKRDGDLCQLCLKPINFRIPARKPMSRSVDHIIPLRAGGTDDLKNLWLAHLVCNQRKGTRHVGRADGTTDVRTR